MTKEAQSRKIDLLFKALGVWGAYQICQMALVKSLSWPASNQLYAYLYIGYQPPLKCQEKGNLTHVDMYMDANLTSDNSFRKKCKDLTNYINGTLISGKCTTGYQYADTKGATIVSEWDLVCDRGYQAALTQTLFVAGQGVGATFFTSLADRFGRRKVCLSSQWMILVVSLASAFSPNIHVLTALKFLTGVAQQGHIMSIHVLPLEILPKENRAMIHLVGSLLWAVLLCIMTGIAYGLRDVSWRYFQVAMCGASVLTIIPNMLFLDESLRWLFANGRVDEARRLIEKASKTNKVDLDVINSITEECVEESLEKQKMLKETTNDETETHDKPEKKSNLVDIFRHPKLRKTTCIMFFAWIVNAGTSFGLTLTSSKLSGNRFMNYFLVSVVYLPAGVIAYVTMQKLGRRLTCIGSHALAGVSLLGAVIVNTYIGPSAWVNALTVIGKFGIGMSWGTLFQYTPELYPTNLRSVGLGISSSASRIGGMFAPFAILVIDNYPWLPGSIYGGCCIVVAFLMFFLPETVDKELPQTIGEINAWKRSKSTTVKNLNL